MPADRKRLFLALWPDSGTRARIVDRTAGVVASVAGKPVRPENLHLTMAFLHSVDVALLPCIGRAARHAAQQPLTLTLSTLGHWKRSGIVWLAPGLQGGSAAGALAAALWEALADCGFTPERRPFRPHVTLARKTRVLSPLPAIEPVVWRVRELALVESTDAGSHPRYEVLQSFYLPD